jgi:hypothetical protein
MDKALSKHQLVKYGESDDKPPKVVDRFPTRSWNVEDFVGKCKEEEA